MLARLAGPDGLPAVSISLADTVAIPDLPGLGAILGDRTCVCVAAALLDPASRGHVRLRPADPEGPPEISLGLVSAPADLDRLMTGVRFAWRLTGTAPLAGLLGRPFVWTERMVADSRLLAAALPRFVAPMWHPAGTARMGPDGDPMAVVDQYCRVRGVRGLRVVDASVMPTIPRATPNLTCIMIAERVAGWMSR